MFFDELEDGWASVLEATRKTSHPCCLLLNCELCFGCFAEKYLWLSAGSTCRFHSALTSGTFSTSPVTPSTVSLGVCRLSETASIPPSLASAVT